MSAKLSDVSMIEFLIDAYGGKDKEYRAKMRNFIVAETKKFIDEQNKVW